MPQVRAPRSRLALFSLALAGAVVAALTGCTPNPTEINASLDPNSGGAFRKLPGQIGITIQDTAQVRRFVIRDGAITEVQNLRKAEQTATASIGPYGATHVLDNGPGYYVRGPYIVSPDRALIAASVELKEVNAAWSTGYVIADLESKKISSMNRSKNLGIAALAWSPDSKFLAILREEQVKVGRSPLEILSAFSGHPVQYMVYSVEVVDPAGKLVAQSRLTQPLTGTWGEVVWGS